MTRLEGVLEIRGPAQARVPLVLDSPHSGFQFPADFGAAVAEADLREGEDAYVDELFAAASEIGAPLLAALWPRTYLDPNRHAGDIDLELLDGPWPGEYRPSGKARVGKALIWRTLDDGRPIYGERLAVHAVQRRIDRYHAPYHQAIERLIRQTRERFGCVYHLNCHSMQAVADLQSEEGQGKRRADFVLGDRDGTSCDPGFTHRVGEILTGLGYEVKFNDPFKGVELVRAYSQPLLGRHSLQIEINKRLYLEAGSLRKSEGFSRLQRDLGEMLRVLSRELSGNPQAPG